MRLTQPQDREMLIAGQAPLRLHRQRTLNSDRPEFLEIIFLPGRGMNLFQIRAWHPSLGEFDVLASPSLSEAAPPLHDDFGGVNSFRFGGAILVPFANRIRGELLPDGKHLRIKILDRGTRLPADWSGKRPGAEKCAIHGLILDSSVDLTENSADHVVALLNAGSFRGRWLSRAQIQFEASLAAESIEIRVTVSNTGEELLPIGIGWHPYFAIPSNKRQQARLRVPAKSRVLVNNYDDVFPAGKTVLVANTPYDFSREGGAPLGSLYLDDCFVELERTRDGEIHLEMYDSESHYKLRLTSLSPQVKAVQVYSPPEAAYVALEPQFNLADPFSDVWPLDFDTGMVTLKPGDNVGWAVRCELFAH